MEKDYNPVREYIVELLNRARVDKNIEVREVIIKSLQSIARGLYVRRIQFKTPILKDVPFATYRKEAVTYLLTHTPLDSDKKYVATETEIIMAKVFIDKAIKKMVLLDFQLEENKEIGNE